MDENGIPCGPTVMDFGIRRVPPCEDCWPDSGHCSMNCSGGYLPPPQRDRDIPRGNAGPTLRKDHEDWRP